VKSRSCDGRATIAGAATAAAAVKNCYIYWLSKLFLLHLLVITNSIIDSGIQ
jgi:hypothetical protein